MKAITITQGEEPLALVDLPVLEVQEKGSCLVRIKAAALNRRDQWIREGMYPGIRFDTVLGSDGCGVVEQGPEEWVGKEVIINPNVNWGADEVAQSREYTVLGMPQHGTLAEYIVVPPHRLIDKPAHLTMEEAAALPLGGLTAYRATVQKGGAGSGKRVLVTGAGGGVSQFAIAFSVALEAETFVTSGSDEKIQRCKKVGVTEGYNYKSEEWWKDAAKVGFDAIIDSAGGEQVNQYLKIVKPGGRIVMYGSTTGYPQQLDVFRLFWSQAQIMGSTMGSDTEFKEMVDFVNQHQIRPTIDKEYEAEDYLAAFDRFKAADHYGKIVLRF